MPRKKVVHKAALFFRRSEVFISDLKAEIDAWYDCNALVVVDFRSVSHDEERKSRDPIADAMW